ncbi:MAG: acyl-CoA dehydrogenase family protein [Endozoicomonas sp.]|uniref:acyl-CoA dehydrogenase family protein n=1 Tax=Endozoicomonas sp. TaxID=1892382 RepID=UPI003D9BDBCD
MDFKLSTEQQDVQKLAIQIFTDQTDNEHLRQFDDTSRYDTKLWSDLGETGILGVSIEPTQGGLGFGFETLCLVLEEAGRTMAPIPLIPVLVSAALPLQRFGTEQQQAILARVASGDCLISTAFAEPLNDDPLTPSTTAERVTGGWQLNGVKHCVPYGAQAEKILISAQSSEGLVALWLSSDSEGVELADQQSTSGEAQSQMTLTNVLVNDTDIMAIGPDAETAMTYALQRTQAALCAFSVGMTDKMVRLTAGYTAEREQFDVKIATFQAVAHRAADAYIDVECLRLATAEAISLLDQEKPADDSVKIAKIWCGDVTHRISQASQHLHGGIGVDRDYPLFRYALWSKQVELTLGGSARLLSELGESIAQTYINR